MGVEDFREGVAEEVDWDGEGGDSSEGVDDGGEATSVGNEGELGVDDEEAPEGKKSTWNEHPTSFLIHTEVRETILYSPCSFVELGIQRNREERANLGLVRPNEVGDELEVLYEDGHGHLKDERNATSQVT